MLLLILARRLVVAKGRSPVATSNISAKISSKQGESSFIVTNFKKYFTSNWRGAAPEVTSNITLKI